MVERETAGRIRAVAVSSINIVHRHTASISISKETTLSCPVDLFRCGCSGRVKNARSRRGRDVVRTRTGKSKVEKEGSYGERAVHPVVPAPDEQLNGAV